VNAPSCPTCSDWPIVLLRGLGVGTRCASGVVTSRDHDQAPGPYIYVATMTSPADVVALIRAEGIVTEQGDILSHAAVISRELDLACVVGTGTLDGLVRGVEVRVCSADGLVLGRRV